MKKIKCKDCMRILKEYNEFECYDEDDNDAVWDDSRKCWMCIDCWREC